MDWDWQKIAQIKEDDPLPELEVISSNTNSNNHRPKYSQPQFDYLRNNSESEIHELIRRNQTNIETLANTLPDKGLKLFKMRDALAEELIRRKEVQLRQEDNEKEKPTQSKSSSTSGACSGFSFQSPSTEANRQSFAKLFSEKLEKKPDCSTPIALDPFDKELSYYGNRQNTRRNRMLSKEDKKESNGTSRRPPFQCPSSFYGKDSKHKSASGAQNINASSRLSPPHLARSLPTKISKRRKASELLNSLDSKSRKSELVLVDEDDEDDCINIRPQQEEPVERNKEVKIYYPSRKDPESVEICYLDIKCLAPATFLSSTIMNFYIRYLQRPVSATGKSRGDYHFSNTYFYGKLKEAVSNKNRDKGNFFTKFRRWWKGINIFQKAYILLPIHENLHWSLVIICIPDKEDESGPIVLHLDSLGYHNSRGIFQNIKSYLQEEWNYLKDGVVIEDIPIADKIWKNLPRRIEEKIITVPQQENDYDCGIFVLFFMERFVEEAPQRLRKKDLAMFGRQWFKFKPEEASGLRKRIRDLLMEEFQNSSLEKDSKESSSASSGDDGSL